MAKYTTLSPDGRIEVHDDDPPKRKSGRPFKTGARKSRTFNFRLRDGLGEQLKAAADKAGHSMSEEIEMRIVASFDIPEIIERAVDYMFTRQSVFVRESAVQAHMDVIGLFPREPKSS